jgi:hypothetical protein
LAAASTACSKQLDSLSNDQKATLQGTLNSAGRAYSAGRTASQSDWADPTAAVQTSDPQRDRMVQGLSNSGCEADLIHMEPGTVQAGWSRFEGPRTYLSLEVSGSPCPVDLDFEIDVQSNPDTTHWISAVTYTYSVSDPGYLALNDVDQIVLNGNTRIDQAWSSNAHAGIEMSGEIHSQLYGTAYFEISGTLDGDSMSSDPSQSRGQILWHLDFPDFTAELKQVRDGKEIHYYANNDEVSQDEFESYFSEGGEPFFYSMEPERIR